MIKLKMKLDITEVMISGDFGLFRENLDTI